MEQIQMGKLLSVEPESIRYEGKSRVLKCPECATWNKAPYQQAIDKIFVVTCKQCGCRYRPS
jgi:hypothetical protein